MNLFLEESTDLLHVCIRRCLNARGKPFERLFICGELAGGIHGVNRLGGGALLSCVVFGRIAGSNACKCLLQANLSTGEGSITQQTLSMTQQRGKSEGFEVPEREYTLQEVAEHSKKDDLWIVVKGWF